RPHTPAEPALFPVVPRLRPRQRMSDEETTTEVGASGPAGIVTPSRWIDAESVGRALAAASPRRVGGPRYWQDARRRRLLALADCCAVALALAIVLPPQLAIWMLAFLPVWILVAKLAGLYDLDHRAMRHLTVDEAPAIFAWGVIGSAVASVLCDLT